MPIYKMNGAKDGKQKYRVRINYQDNSGTYKQLTRIAYGHAEAKELEKKLMNEIKLHPGVKRMSLKELCDEYIIVKRNEIRESTVDKSERILNNHVLDSLSDIKIHKLNSQNLTQWKLRINNKDLSLETKKKIYSVFRAVLNYAVQMDYLSNNPLLKVGNFKDANIIQKKEIRYYTADEFKKYIKVAREQAESSPNLSGWDYYVFFNIAFYTGLRKGEIHALRWSDIDGNYLSVSRSIAQKLKGEDRETPPKNKSSIRTLQMPKPLIDILKEHKERYMKLEGFTEDFRICGGTKPLRDTTIEKRNKKFAENAGVKHIRIHDFRHSHASILANEGINIQEIARRLGHSKIEITWNTYAHLYPREEERAVKILEKIV